MTGKFPRTLASAMDINRNIQHCPLEIVNADNENNSPSNNLSNQPLTAIIQQTY